MTREFVITEMTEVTQSKILYSSGQLSLRLEKNYCSEPLQ